MKYLIKNEGKLILGITLNNVCHTLNPNDSIEHDLSSSDVKDLNHWFKDKGLSINESNLIEIEKEIDIVESKVEVKEVKKAKK